MSFLEKLLKGIVLAVATFSTVKKVFSEEEDKNQNKDKEKNSFDDVIDI